MAVIVPPGSCRSGWATLLDLCELANRYTSALYETAEEGTRALRPVVLSLDGNPVHAIDGRIITVDGGLDSDKHAAVYVGAFEPGDPGLQDTMRVPTWGQGSGRLCRWLKRQYANGAWIAASGAATFVLAEAGLLNGAVAAPPWLRETVFRRRFPRVRLDLAQPVVVWKRILTAAASAAEPALALRLLEATLSPNLGEFLWKVTNIEHADLLESAYVPEVILKDPLVGRARLLLQQQFSCKLSFAELAADLGVSQRTLIRRFRASIDMTPLGYLQRLRVESAKQMLAKTGRSIDSIGYMVGYGDAGHFKALFRRRVGLTPAQFRRQSQRTLQNQGA